MKPMQLSFPKNYDPNVKCDYHERGVGHSTEKCVALKHKVKTLINSGWVKFHEDKPSVKANSLSGHGNPSTNAIEDREQRLRKLIPPLFLTRVRKLSRGNMVHVCRVENKEQKVNLSVVSQRLKIYRASVE